MLEPGLITVFRLYAVLRVLLVVAGTLAGLWQASDTPERVFSGRLVGDSTNTYLVPIFILLLLLYLYWHKLQEKLGRAYLPLGLGLATFSLFLEQYRFASPSFLWQPDAFFFILLILVAWQYGLRGVAVFVLGISALDLASNWLFTPVMISFVTRAGGAGNVVLSTQEELPPGFQTLIIGGRVLARSLSYIVIGFVVTRLVHAQRQQREELAAANLRLREHAVTLEQLATSRERNRLSRELHDTLAHTLSGLTVQLEAMRTAWERIPSKAEEMLEKMLSVTRDGLEETRRALKNLRAAPLEELGLALAIQTLAEEVCQRNNLALDLTTASKTFDVPVDVQQSFYRVAQEALANVVRHAQASSVKLQLNYYRHGLLELIVQDDGRGFDLNRVDASERLGVQLMRERADLIGADFQIDSKPEQGTTIKMSV